MATEEKIKKPETLKHNKLGDVKVLYINNRTLEAMVFSFNTEQTYIINLADTNYSF